MKTAALYLWQLPQNMVGLIFLLFMKQPQLIEVVGDVKIYVSKGMSGGISLGNYIFLSTHSSKVDDTIIHELKHSKQSRMLGWFYVLVVGLPSLIHAIVHSTCDYYHFYTEKWAEKLKNKKQK